MKTLAIYCLACWLIMFFGIFDAHLRYTWQLFGLIFAPVTLPLSFGGAVYDHLRSKSRAAPTFLSHR